MEEDKKIFMLGPEVGKTVGIVILSGIGQTCDEDLLDMIEKASVLIKEHDHVGINPDELVIQTISDIDIITLDGDEVTDMMKFLKKKYKKKKR